MELAHFLAFHESKAKVMKNQMVSTSNENASSTEGKLCAAKVGMIARPESDRYSS